MLRVSLDRLVNILETKTQRRVTIAEISSRTGIHRNILGRILNRPFDYSSTRHIEKLAEFFFYELRQSLPLGEEQLATYIISNLIEFFPEQSDHKQFLESLKRVDGSVEVPIGLLWEFFRLSHGAPAAAEPAAEEEWDKTAAIKKRLGDQEIERPRPKRKADGEGS